MNKTRKFIIIVSWITVSLLHITLYSTARNTNKIIQHNLPQIEKINIVNRFGADPTGKKSSHDAFEAAANYINKRHGYVDLYIPRGIYRTGRQIRMKAEGESIFGFKGSNIFSLLNCSNVLIHGDGSNKTKIVLTDGLRYGSFKANGEPPANPNDNNWYAKRNDKDFKMKEYYPYRADIGCVIKLSQCSNITINDIGIDGNSGKYILGGDWSDSGKQIDADAFMIEKSSNLRLSAIAIKAMGRDGILIIAPGDTDPLRLTNHDITFDKVDITGCGRNGISWCSGSDFNFINCSVSYTGFGAVKSAPASAIDIEPELSICRNGNFVNCIFNNNYNSGLICDRGNNPIPDAYAMKFTNCSFIQDSSGVYANFLRGKANSFLFTKCRFHGASLDAVNAESSSGGTTYRNCFFTDCYNGVGAWKDINSFLLQAMGSHLLIDSCVFTHYNIGALAIRGEGKKCTETEEGRKTVIKNSSFNSYLFKCSKAPCPPVGSGYAWLTKFLNNTFNFGDIPYQIDPAPGCSGTGNSDLGYGLVMKKYPPQFKMPVCKK